MTRLCAAGALAGLVVAGLVSTTGSAGAQDAAAVTEVGWWSTNPAAQPADEGGFQVAHGPDGGAISVAAVRVLVEADTLTSAVIFLNEDTAVNADQAALKVCATTDGWAPANPGPMGDAPPRGCAKSVKATRDTSGGSWSADVRTLLAGTSGTASLVIVSEAAGGGLGVLPVQIDFTDATLLSTGTFSTTTTAPPSSPSPSPSGEGPTFTPAPAVAPPPTPSFSPPPIGATETPTTTVPAAPVPDSGQQTEPELASGDDFDLGTDAEPKPWGRIAFIVPISGVLGVGAVRLRRVLDERGLIGQTG